MKKLILVSAVLIGAATASQAGVLPGPGLHVRLPFLPEIAMRAPALPIAAPPVVVAPRVVYDAPREVVVAPERIYQPAPVEVCAPAPVVRVPAAPLCPPAPAFRPELRGWHARPERDFRRWDHGRPERDFHHDDRGWEHGPEGHHGR